jgi:hypothetical protein
VTTAVSIRPSSSSGTL